eukprot:m51a1_g4067 putative deoxyuridine 5 -triphosphate nucleotidohydrolase (145) ;mRNA; f:751869-752374
MDRSAAVLPGVGALGAIGYVRSTFAQSAYMTHDQIASQEARIEVLPELSAGLDGIECHTWLLTTWHLTVERPGAGGENARPKGVFATGSPSRPNLIGAAVVRLVSRNGCTLHVVGLDALDGSPVVDIKPASSCARPLLPPFDHL